MLQNNNKNSAYHRVFGCLIGLISLAVVVPAYANELMFEPSARYRFQEVSDDERGDATASTLKLRLSAQLMHNNAWSSFAEVDHVIGFNENNFNSVTVTRNTSPITEALGTELNQAWLQYTSDFNWSAKLGRQMLSYDNDRHVSSLEFWQNDQTYDAFSVLYNDAIAWEVNYAYLSKVHRIFGDDSKAVLPENDIRFANTPIRPFLELGNHSHQSHLLHIKYKANQYVALSSYAYLLDNKTASQLSSNTFGVRITGEAKPASIKYGYTGEIAHQKTAKNSAWDYSGYYAFAELSAQYKSHQLALAHERLTENNGFAFATSLGDNHLFMGWADIFTSYLNTDGIRDTFVTYRGRKAKLRWRAVAHQFRSDTNGEIAGHELDVELAYRFNREWEATFLYSAYLAKEGIENLTASEHNLHSWTLSVSYNL